MAQIQPRGEIRNPHLFDKNLPPPKPHFKGVRGPHPPRRAHAERRSVETIKVASAVNIK